MAKKTSTTSSDRLLTSNLPWAVFKFGGPLALGMVLHTTFNLIDMFMVSRLPDASGALAALGICDMVAAVATILSHGVATGAVAMISRHLGAKHWSGLRRVVWQSTWVVALLGLAFGVLGIAGSNWLVESVLRAKGEAALIAGNYLRVMLGGCITIFLLLHITSVLRALGHAKTAAILLVGGNALNILLNVFFIYGDGPAPVVFAWGGPIAESLGIPRMGVMGAAWATIIGRTVPVLLGSALLLRRKGGPKFHPVYLRPFWQVLKTLWRLSWPASGQLVLRVVSILFLIALVSDAYTTVEDQSALTAFSICLRLETMALFASMGWGAAASTFVGANLGARNLERAKQAGWWAALFNTSMMLILSLLYLQLGAEIIGFFDADPMVVAIGQQYLSVVALSYVLLGAGTVLSQAMTGAGATLTSLVVDLVVLGGMVLPAAYWVSISTQSPRHDLWQVIAIGNGLSLLVYLFVYAQGSFLRKSV